MHALEPKCASPHSSDSKRAVAQLSEQSEAYKASFLWNAVVDGLSNLVRCALEAKISANTRSGDDLNRPVLVQAAITGCTRILNQFLDAGADPSATDTGGCTALFAAAQKGHLDCLQLLLVAGADASEVNDLGTTPFMTAVCHKHRDCVQALLPVSDLAHTSNQGMSAFHICMVTGNEACLELLMPLINDVDVRTLAGVQPDGQAVPLSNQTALHLACQYGQQQMAKALLKRGADRIEGS